MVLLWITPEFTIADRRMIDSFDTTSDMFTCHIVQLHPHTMQKSPFSESYAVQH